MISHLLDTNSVVDHLRKGSDSKVTARIRASSAGSVVVCSVVLAELHYGAHHSGPAHIASNLVQIAAMLQTYRSLPFDDNAAQEYGRVREFLTVTGQKIGSNDLMIAAIALAYRLTLVTNNTREFSRVPGLTLEDWM